MPNLLYVLLVLAVPITYSLDTAWSPSTTNVDSSLVIVSFSNTVPKLTDTVCL